MVQRTSPSVAVLGLVLGAAMSFWMSPSATAKTPPTPAPEGDAARGEVLAALGSCGACHTHRNGAPYAGGYEVKTPNGTFVGPNITPHETEGIGAWSYADFERAMRKGRSPEGHAYWPAFPYTSFTKLHDQELADLWAYLRGLEPQATPNQPHDLPFGVTRFPSLGFWRLLYFQPGEHQDDPDQSEAWNLGAYLAEGIGHCGECHSPRGGLGQVKRKHPLSGSDAEPEPAPNITPAGLRGWSEGDAAYFLESAMTAEGDVVGGEMARIVEEGTGRLSETERQALATWLLALEPWPEVQPGQPPEKGDEDDEDDEDDEPWM